nr:MAG TPA: hypothetical protein [Caudoviricetes sp.]
MYTTRCGAHCRTFFFCLSLLKSVNVVHFVGQSVAHMLQRYYLCGRNKNKTPTQK